MAAAAVVGKLGSVPSAGSSDTSKVVAQPVGGVPAVSASLLSTVAGRLKEYSVAVYGQVRQPTP